jgi:hypothetical protein
MNNPVRKFACMHCGHHWMIWPAVRGESVSKVDRVAMCPECKVMTTAYWSTPESRRMKVLDGLDLDAVVMRLTYVGGDRASRLVREFLDGDYTLPPETVEVLKECQRFANARGGAADSNQLLRKLSDLLVKLPKSTTKFEMTYPVYDHDKDQDH